MIRIVYTGLKLDRLKIKHSAIHNKTAKQVGSGGERKRGKGAGKKEEAPSLFEIKEFFIFAGSVVFP